MQLKVQREMRLLQRSERESKRQGAFGTGADRSLLPPSLARTFPPPTVSEACLVQAPTATCLTATRGRSSRRGSAWRRGSVHDMSMTCPGHVQARLGLAQKLLPAAGGDDAARQRRNEAEGLVEKAAASGWSQLSPAEQAGFEELWRTALPSLPAQEVRRGREEGLVKAV